MNEIREIFKDWEVFELQKENPTKHSFKYGIKKENVVVDVDGVYINSKCVISNEFNYGKSMKEIKILDKNVDRIGELLDIYLRFTRLQKK